MRLLAIAWLGLWTLMAWAPGRDEEAERIVRLSVRTNATNYEALPRYNYFKVDHGRDGRTRSYEELMLLGSRYSKLVAIDGHPLSPRESAAEAARLEQTRKARNSESAGERKKRVESYERERRRDAEVLAEMPRAFDFTLVGEQQLNAHDVYVIKAKPRAGYKPPTSRTRVLTGMEGTLWIEKNSYQWVRVEAEVMRPVSIEGFLARVEKGTRFELDQMPASEGLWFPSYFSMKAQAKILFFFSHREEEEESYYGYHPVVAADNQARQP